MHTRLTILAVVTLLPLSVLSYAAFQNRIPNGGQVPHPCKPNALWKGVGHFNVDGGGNRNPFGLDFKAADLMWTPELCRKDSDGDGLTNGEELGDPDCVWTPNSLPKNTAGLSHPGVCEPMDSETCSQKTLDNGLYRVQEEWMADACKSGQFVCDGLDAPDVRNQTIRFPSTPVPAEETTYQCAIFEFENNAEDVHLIATTPLLDNRQVMHHIVLFGCDGETTGIDLATPYRCGMSAHRNCSRILSIWTLGQNGECYHPATGVRMGLNGFKRIALQFHWNNPEKADNYFDASAMTLYYTANLRPNDAGVWLVGNRRFTIPPGQERVVVNSTCTPTCTGNNMKQPLHITAAWNHMHYLGVSQSIEHIRDGVSLRYITNDATYSYDSPKTYHYPSPIEVLPGDELRTVCYYNSLSRAQTTVFGDSTQQEMCYGFLYYYPVSALTKGSCVARGSVIPCDPETYRGCNQTLFDQHLDAYLRKKLEDSCSNHGTCYAECKAAILEARSQEPCMRHEDLWENTKGRMSGVESDSRFLGALASCEAQIAVDDAVAAGRVGSVGDASLASAACDGGGKGGAALMMLAFFLSVGCLSL